MSLRLDQTSRQAPEEIARINANSRTWLHPILSITSSTSGQPILNCQDFQGAMGRVMARLPAAQTLPIARDRLYHQEWHERFLAEHLYPARAIPEDVPLLRATIQRALSDDEANCYRLCNLVEAFSELSNIGPIPELADAFVQFRYSFGRVRAAEALRATAPDEFRPSFALECLWDCEEGTRLVGVGSVPLERDEALGRLRWLAKEASADKEVKAEARKRLPQNGT
jgi:hypothetical protein